MGIFTRKGPTPAAELPAPLPTNTLAGAAQLGGVGGSGITEPWTALQPRYHNGQAITEDVGRHVLPVDAAQLPDLPADSIYVSRPLYGGVRTASAFGEYRDAVNIGGHVVMSNRPPLVLVEGEQMAPQTWASDTEWRDAPPVVNLCRRGAENVPGGFTGKAVIS